MQIQAAVIDMGDCLCVTRMRLEEENSLSVWVCDIWETKPKIWPNQIVFT